MKNIKKILVSVSFFALLALALLFLFYHNEKEYTSVFFSLDTVVSMRLSEDFTDECEDLISDISDIFDIYSTSSEISELNEKKTLRCSDYLYEFTDSTKKLCDMYGNRVDISAGNLSVLWSRTLENGQLPSHDDINRCLETAGMDNIIISENLISLKNDSFIDPGAAAKGYALDKAMELCCKYNPENAIISLGSSTLLYSSDSSRIFNVAIKSDRENLAGTVHTNQCFVSTSGDYERFTEINGRKYHHIIDTQTGYPSETGLSSVTVFCDSGIASDFLSTLIFIEGKENLQKHLNSEKYSIVAIDTDGNIYHSHSLDFERSSNINAQT